MNIRCDVNGYAIPPDGNALAATAGFPKSSRVFLVSYIAVVFVAYLLGSIPSGYLMGRIRGVDIRRAGSGNIGATNALRVLGKPAGIFVMIVDGLKGYAACAWATDLVLNLCGVSGDPGLHRVLAGIAAVLGHNYTCWLNFKGGKGIATSAGVYFALSPISAAIAVASWVLVLAVTRIVSIASITAAVVLPVSVWIWHPSLLLKIVTTLLGLMAIYKHKGNIQRLRAGTEPRIGQKSQAKKEES
jgi:glycerol-3-phosphate acyltransferase PlsY